MYYISKDGVTFPGTAMFVALPENLPHQPDHAFAQ